MGWLGEEHDIPLLAACWKTTFLMGEVQKWIEKW